MIELKKRYSAGKFLKTMILEERGLTQKWLAQKIGRAERKISEICNNKRRITASCALELEKVFGLSAEFWMSMQSKWDVFVTRQEKKRNSCHAIDNPFPFKTQAGVGRYDLLCHLH